jgi:autotransporter passenger strand-loop-strand repeat protein
VVLTSAGHQVVGAGGSAQGVIVSSGATEVIGSGGSAANVIVLSGGEIDLNGGTVQNLTVRKGGIVFQQTVESGSVLRGGLVGHDKTQTVLSGGLTIGAIISGRRSLQSVNGSATGTTVDSGGTQAVGGQTFGTVISSGGYQNVGGRGTTSQTIISSGGEQIVGAFAQGTIVRAGGSQTVVRQGKATNTVVSSGGFEIVSGGIAAGTTVLSGGELMLSNFAKVVSGLNVSSGGYVDVGYLANLPSFVVNKGVTLVVDVYGSATNPILNGGTLIQHGGNIVGAVTFRGHSTYLCGPPIMVVDHVSASTSGFSSTDKIDLLEFNFDGTETFSFSENAAKTKGVLTVSSGSMQAQITMFGQYVAAGFHLASDGSTGTTITYSTPSTSHTELAVSLK